MRLFPRLLLTQTLPLLIVVIAVGLVFASTTQVTSILEDLRAGELTTLRIEAALHRAGWDVDVSMRHATAECRTDAPTQPVRAARVGETAAALERTLARAASADPVLREVSQAYVDLAAEVDPRAPCDTLASEPFESRRALLDEQLTNAWVGRMAGLHDAVMLREDQAQRAGDAGLAGGVILVLVALVIALAVSLAFARSVAAPLTRLTHIARRMGKGDFGAPVGVVGGPTELVEFGEELEAMRSRLAELDSLKQQFVASVSHEMRTPLSKLREALALLADGAAGELGPRQQQVVRIARDACERQIRTVTSMLDLSRLRAGSPLRLREQASLDGAIRAAIDEERADAAAAGVTVDLELEGAPNVVARLDDVLFERAVANLVRNAVSVSSTGQRVQVRRAVLDRGPDGDAGGWVRLSVRDEGPGLPPELEKSIFQPFVSHAIAGSPKKVGVGLGLALASEVARAHGGRLSVVRPERGSEFQLWVPVPAAGAAATGPAEVSR